MVRIDFIVFIFFNDDRSIDRVVSLFVTFIYVFQRSKLQHAGIISRAVNIHDGTVNELMHMKHPAHREAAASTKLRSRMEEETSQKQANMWNPWTARLQEKKDQEDDGNGDDENKNGGGGPPKKKGKQGQGADQARGNQEQTINASASPVPVSPIDENEDADDIDQFYDGASSLNHTPLRSRSPTSFSSRSPSPISASSSHSNEKSMEEEGEQAVEMDEEEY